ncbi:SCO6745 family protein [Streptomyces xanthophaeus]|uniref:SCO6745 family protein n=1 Tax=Streptomyces xanthophaeus TaxID=67385 RepID=UPI00398FF2DF
MTNSGVHGLGTIRRLWQLLEPVHAVVYFAPESYEEAGTLGYATDDRWPLYFAYRAAPLGPVGPELVGSLFYSFAPRMVQRYAAHTWRTADPARVLAARATATDRTLRRVFGERTTSADLAEAARLARRAAEAAAPAGRPLAAANSALPWPEAPHAALWHAATILREHRGDGHLIALQAHHLDPVESLVLQAGVGAVPAGAFESRQWTAQDWSAARERLVTRDLLDGDGAATDAGLALRTAVEKLTDELAAAPWTALTPPEAARLAELLLPLALDIVGADLLPTQSTLGIGMKYDYQD